MTAALTLLNALAAIERRTAREWGDHLRVNSHWIGRGVAGKTRAQDRQILDSLATGHLAMPLWGVSLDRQVASAFGSRFTFEMAGRFPAIAVWKHSFDRAREQELIVGGHYDVLSIVSSGMNRHVVVLRYTGHVPPSGEI